MAQAGMVTVSGGGNVTPAKRLIMMGRKFKNLVRNGNFASGTDGYYGAAAVLAASDGILSVTGSGTSANVYIRTGVELNLSAAAKGYARIKFRVTNSVCSKLYAYTIWQSKETEIQAISNPIKDQWYYLDVPSTEINMVSGSGNLTIFIRMNYADANTAKDKVMEVESIVFINKTAEFGEGNEPDQAWCDANIPQNIIW
jgi:hypothetical protein